MVCPSVDFRGPQVAAMPRKGHKRLSVAVRKRAVVAVAPTALRSRFRKQGRSSEFLDPLPLFRASIRDKTQVSRSNLSINQRLSIRSAGIGKHSVVSRGEFTLSVRMPSRHCQRKRTQIAPETHFQKCVTENLVAFLRNGKRGAPKHPNGVHRPVKSSHGISRIGLAVVID